MKNFLIFCSMGVFLLLLINTNSVNCGKILVIIPVPLFSHQIPFRNLIRALIERGHEIVFVTAIPTKDTSNVNYTEIDLSIVYNAPGVTDYILMMQNFHMRTKLEMDEVIYKISHKATEDFYNHPDVKRIISAGDDGKFDLVVAEGLLGIGFYAMAYILKVPLISVASLDMHMYQNYILGGPILPSHPSNWEFFSRIRPDISLWERLTNYLLSLIVIYRWYHYQSSHEELVRSLIKRDIPPLYDIAKNMSLHMINYDPLIGFARPLPPNVILFNGLHIEEKPPALSRELNEFLGNTTNGFIYMSLGCSMNSSMLPSNTLQAIYNVFSKLPHKVLWKYETDDILRNSNIFTDKWFPQQSILAHPNIKLFVFQGGLQSTEETVHYGIPIIGMPIMYDQDYRVNNLVSFGTGRALDITKIDEETFHEAVYDVLNNKSYKTRMTELSRLMKDKPYNSKEHTVWWIEYVMRHKGAPHLRFKGADEPWYQRYDLDVIAILSVILFILSVTCIIILIRIFVWFYRRRHVLLYFSKYSPSVRKKHKAN